MTQPAPISFKDGKWRKEAIACALILLVGCILRLVDLQGVVRRTPDENIYASQASTITQHGARPLADQWRQDPSLFQYPPPVRVGYLYPLSWAQRIAGNNTPSTGAFLACLADMSALLLLGLIAWRHLSPQIAIYAMSLYAVSPPMLMMARREWMEPYTSCLALLLFLLCLECLAQPSRRAWLVAAGCCAGWSITVKETCMIDAALLVGLLCIALLQQKRRSSVGLVLGCSLVTAAAGAMWLSNAIGGTAQVIDFFHRAYASEATNAYDIAYLTGSPLSWLSCIWVSDPLLVSLAIPGLFILWRNRSRVLFWALLVSVLFFILPVFSSHRLDLRFSSFSYAPLCLIGAITVQAAWRWIQSDTMASERRWLGRFALAALLCALAINYLSYYERFVRTDMQDLSIRMVLDEPPPL